MILLSQLGLQRCQSLHYTLQSEEPSSLMNRRLDPPTAGTICELALKLHDVRGVSSIWVTHRTEEVRFSLIKVHRCRLARSEKRRPH